MTQCASLVGAVVEGKASCAIDHFRTVFGTSCIVIGLVAVEAMVDLISGQTIVAAALRAIIGLLVAIGSGFYFVMPLCLFQRLIAGFTDGDASLLSLCTFVKDVSVTVDGM